MMKYILYFIIFKNIKTFDDVKEEILQKKLFENYNKANDPTRTRLGIESDRNQRYNKIKFFLIKYVEERLGTDIFSISNDQQFEKMIETARALPGRLFQDSSFELRRRIESHQRSKINVIDTCYDGLEESSRTEKSKI